jgi:hypothetical protein
VPALEARIDELFAGPLAKFTPARNALAKTLTGADAARVKALSKPTVVAWALNQVYWHARDVFERAVETGDRVRKAQIAILQGKTVDLRAATEAHREAVAAAVKEAERLAAAAGSHPAPDALTRTLEALSLAPKPPAPFGRLTSELQPAGFDALAGITGLAVHAAHHPAAAPRSAPQGRRSKAAAAHQGHATREEERREEARRAEEARRLEQEAKQRAAELRQRDADIRKAEAALARAQGAERMAHDAWLRTQKEVDEARQRLSDLRSRRD